MRGGMVPAAIFEGTPTCSPTSAPSTGIGLIAMVFVGPQTPWGWIGLVPLATALIGYCPAYQIFGIRTCRAPRVSGGPATQS